MEIVKLPWIFMSAQVCGGLGMILRHEVASETNTWQTGGRQMLTVTVVMHGMIVIMWQLKIYFTQVRKLFI